MKKILILCEDREVPVIQRQLYSNPVNDCLFTFNREEPYDFFVVLDGFSQATEVKVDRSYRLLFLGETPYVKRYNKKYLSQFGGVYGCDKHGLYKGDQHMMEIFPWFIGRKFNKDKGVWEVTKTFHEIENFNNINRPQKICLLTSDKASTRGHKDRLEFVRKLKSVPFKYQIDVYGNGFIPFGDKFDVLKDYEYSIVIENSRYPDYFTEKILDCLLMGCYPIYYGCSEIFNYFPKDCLTPINIKDFDSSLRTITEVVEADLFRKNQDFICEGKKRVLYDYNLFTVISKIISKYPSKESYCPENAETIYPNAKNYWEIATELIARKTNIVL